MEAAVELKEEVLLETAPPEVEPPELVTLIMAAVRPVGLQDSDVIIEDLKKAFSIFDRLN